jgi:hypothetical protein
MRYLAFLIITISVFACKKKNVEKYHDFKFYPAIQTNVGWKKNEHFTAIPVTLKMESRIQEKNCDAQGMFEEIKNGSLKVWCDQDIQTIDSIIKKDQDLLMADLCKLHVIKAAVSKDSVNDFYILQLDQSLKINRTITKGALTIFITGKFLSNYEIKDSTVVYLE